VRILPDDQDAVESWIDWIDRKDKNMAREAKAEKSMGLHSESVARTCFGTPMSTSIRSRNPDTRYRQPLLACPLLSFVRSGEFTHLASGTYISEVFPIIQKAVVEKPIDS
jgi:hypothetical protein